jgi:hypothetical protein
MSGGSLKKEENSAFSNGNEEYSRYHEKESQKSLPGQKPE